MTVAVDQVYTIKITDYPWSDDYAKTNSTLLATMLKEEDAKRNLDGCKVKITDPDPPQDQFHQGDRGLTGKWVRGTLQNGPLMYGKIAVLESWLLPTSSASAPNICNCPLNTILAKGCQCGGS